MARKEGLEPERVKRLLRKIQNWRLCLEAGSEVGIADGDVRKAMHIFDKKVPGVWANEQMRWNLWEQSLREAGVDDRRLQKARESYLERLRTLEKIDWDQQAEALLKASRQEEGSHV